MAGANCVALPSSKTYESIINFLGPHGPDGLLAFIIFVGVMGAGYAGLDLWFSGLVGVGVYSIYGIRRTLAERHQERSAEQVVVRKELELQEYRERQLAKLAREKLKALPPAKSREGKK